MEDYEKKYKDALAIVKSYYGRSQFSSVHDTKEEINTLERAFPELKDVKSERVKEDIKYILANTDLSKVPSSFSDMLEWVDNREDKTEILDGEDYGIDGLYHAISILEKTLGEVEGYQSDDGILDHKIAIDTVKELYSKRPKWSDEDADNLEEIIMFCDTLAGGYLNKLTNERLKSISKTLKAIKKGTVTPTNQERSEEDASRSWSIQDAKDGDVLVHNGCTFIFMGIKDGIVQAIEENMLELIPFGELDKDNDYHPATKEQRDLLFQKMKEAGYEWDVNKRELKKMEQKPVDEAGPKFKVGDWIIKNDDSPINIDYSCCKITKVENGNYTIESIDGYKGYNTFETFEKDYHLWTIQDAKDGDVIFYDNGWTCIFKNIHGIWYSSYCFITADWEFNTGYERHFVDAKLNGNANPATKEQRDTLMKAMANAGYTFDAEKKELKKIEEPENYKRQVMSEMTDLVKDYITQKPNAWSEEDSIRLQRIIDFLWYNRKGDTDTIYQQEQDIDWLKSLKNRVQPQPKQEWSDKDKKMIHHIENAIKYDKSRTYLNSKGIEIIDVCDWFKSLKERVQPQPKQEWSEEDERRMENLCHFLEEYGDQYYGGLTLKGIINWIKSLRHQNVWISVDEEVYVEEPVLAQKKDKSDPFKGYVVCCDHTLVPNVYERYMILSNIVSHSTWKPSDEQMKALGIAIRSGIQLGTWEEDALKSLAEQLKKLSEE